MTAACGCCEPLAPLTPASVENRPALSAIAYRIGTYGSFRETMLERIAAAPELAPLTTRRDDDHAIALLDLWAAVADVLTFYQERYANEAFLRTATQQESIARLSRLIGYRPRPGIAALATLAFTVDEGMTVELPRGLRVQSIPGPDEQPQVFETLESLHADARLNRLRVLPDPEPANPFQRGRSDALLAPGEPGLRAARALAPGDRILIHGVAGAEQVTVKEVRAEDDGVRLVWEPPIQRSWRTPPTAHRVGRSFGIFGHNVPPQSMQAAKALPPASGIKWSLKATNYTLDGGEQLPLDARYDGLAEGAKLLVVDGSTAHAATVAASQVAQASLQGYSDTVTHLSFGSALPPLDRTTTTVHELHEPIPFWGNEYPRRLHGATVLVPERRAGSGAVEIDGTIELLQLIAGTPVEPSEIDMGRRVMVGDASTAPVPARIVAAESRVGQDFLRLDLALEEPLDLDPHTAFLLGNVAEASHGETVRNEVLGDADAGAAFQRFVLRRKPLTYLPSPKAGGAEAAAEVRVNGVRWHQAASLYGQAPTDEVFVLGQDDDGATTVRFGDGVSGDRPANGSVTATYRSGAGLAGRVRAGTLETALDRPPGLREVTNPLRARGGADAEPPEGARENAPQTVRTIGRAVSLRDFEDLVRSSGEVAKASAISVWDGLARAIHLTVAGQAGEMDFTADDLGRFAASLRATRDPNYRLSIANCARLPVRLRATVEVDRDRVAGDVVAAVSAAAAAALSFDSLRLAEPLHLSDMYAALQGVEGVAGVDIDEFQPKRPADRERPNVDRLDGSPAPLQPHIRIYPARPDPDRAGVVLPAELAVVEDPSGDLEIFPAAGVAP